MQYDDDEAAYEAGNRFVIHTASSPRHSWRWGHRGYIAVLDLAKRDPRAPISSCTVRAWNNLDGRYRGPRSGFGRALAAARVLCNQLNDACAIAAAGGKYPRAIKITGYTSQGEPPGLPPTAAARPTRAARRAASSNDGLTIRRPAKNTG